MSRGSAVIAILIAAIGGFAIGNITGKASGGGGDGEAVAVVPAPTPTAEAAAPGAGVAGAGARAGAGAAAAATPRIRVPVTNAQPSKGGGADALVTIVEFSEFQCPFCSRVLPTQARILEEYGDQVRIVWRNNPLGFHDNAMPAAEAAMEAYAQGGADKFWQLHDLLFANQRELGRENLDRFAQQVGLNMARYRAAMDGHTHRAAIQADQQLAARVGARGTPNSFVNGIQVTGARPFEAFKEIIDRELANARQLVQRGTPANQVYATLMRGAQAQAAPPAPANNRPARPQPDPAAVYRVPIEGNQPSRGPENALVTIVEVSDFQCPYCSRAENTINQVLEAYPRDVRVVWFNNPLSFHDNAGPAANAALEAFQQGGNEKFWAMHDLLFANQRALSRENLESYAQQVGLNMAQFRAALDNNEHQATIDAQQRLATSLGAGGTPAFFINGRYLRGAQPLPAFRSVIDEELTRARALVAAGAPRNQVYARAIAEGSTRPVMLPAAGGGAAAPNQPAAPARPQRVNLAVPANAPSKGPANAPVVIQEISDYQCPFCSRVTPTIDRVMREFNGRVRLVWRDLPLPMHPNAHIAAQAAREVHRQGGNDKFWAYNALLFENQRNLTRETLESLAQGLGGINMAQFRQALDSERHKAAVDADMAAAQAAGVRGTPGFVINGTVISGAQPYERFEAAINAALGS